MPAAMASRSSGELHVRAVASYGRGSWLSALALVGMTDTAERLWRGDGAHSKRVVRTAACTVMGQAALYTADAPVCTER